MKEAEKKKVCPVCQYVFFPKRVTKIYCCKMCARKAHQDRAKMLVKGMRRR